MFTPSPQSQDQQGGLCERPTDGALNRTKRPEGGRGLPHCHMATVKVIPSHYAASGLWGTKAVLRLEDIFGQT
jgi:hypothetical protein